MVVVAAVLLARQTASRRLRVDGTVVVLVVQASTVSMSAVVFTFKMRVASEVTSMGTDCDEVSTTMSRPASIFCGKARAAMGVPEKETSALGLAVLPEVSRI